MAEKKTAVQDNVDKLKEDLKDETFDDAGDGLDDVAPDPDLDDDIDTSDLDGGDAGDDAGGDDDDADADDLDGDDDPDDDADADPSGGDQDAELLEGMDVVKNEKGEFISKAAFLKRLAKESGSLKEARTELATFEKYKKNQPHYKRWEDNHESFENAVKFNEQIGHIVTAQPWLQNVLGPLMAGKPVDWKRLAFDLRDVVLPHLISDDGEYLQPPEAPAGQVDPQIAMLQKTVTDMQVQQKTVLENQQADVRQGELKTTYDKAFKNIWSRHKAYKNSLYRNLLIDKARAIAAENSAKGEHGPVDLEAIADDLFGGLNKLRKKRRQDIEKNRGRSRKAASDKPGGPTAKPSDGGVKLSPREAMKKRMVERHGKNFS